MLHELPTPKTKKKMVRKGRGAASGKGGHTATRGMKGQKSRSGYKVPRPGFEGGQMPLSRRLPRLRGYSRKSSRGHRGYFLSKIKHHTLQLSEVAEQIKDGVVNEATLREAGMIYTKSKKVQTKIVFDQDIKQKLTVEGIPTSATAKAAIEKAGGKVS